MNSERWDALHVDIYAEIGYHLGIDDSDDGACDAKNRAALGVMRLIEREIADAETLAAKIEAVWDWIARVDPHPERNGDQLADLRRILSSRPWPRSEPLAMLQRAARRAAGERDAAALDHCDSCHRPLPHNEAEQTACPGTPGLVSNERPFGPCFDPVADPGQPLTCGPCGFDLAEHRPQPDNHRSNR